MEKRLRNGEKSRKEIEEKESRKCFACANGTSQESNPDKMHRPLSVQLASEKAASWPDVRSAIAARCSMGESDVEQMGAEASSVFVCCIHSNDLRRAIAQVMHSPPCVLCETTFDTPGQTRPFRLPSSTEEIDIAEERVFIHFKHLQRERITLRNCVNKHWFHACRLLVTGISVVTTAFIRDSLRNCFGKHPTIMKLVVSETLARLGVDAPPHLPIVHCEEQSSQHLLLREVVEIYVKHRREQTDLNAPASIAGRTLMRYGFSNLAAEGVHAACGSRKSGHAFYAPPNIAASQRFV